MLKQIQDAATPTQGINSGLDNFHRTGNLAPLLTQQQLAEIASKCFEGMENDKQTMGDWHKIAKEARGLAKMNSERELPFVRASDVQVPTLAVACMQFAARAYPSIINNDQPVLAKTFGADDDGAKKDRAERVSDFMSWQVTEGIEGWDEDMDDMLHILPLVGTAFKKAYFCASRGKPVSELVPMENVVFDIKAKRGRIPRISERMDFYGWEIQERIRRGTWIDFDMGQPDDRNDDSNDEVKGQIDESSPYIFHEQHCRIDLDGDGYEEPYIVMLHDQSQSVVRISPNYQPTDVERDEQRKIISINPSATYIPFKFIPDPENRAMGIGYGTLMVKLGSAINSIINQLLDAGTLANSGGGVMNKNIKGLNIGTNEIDLSKWYKGEIPDDISKLFVEFPRPKPDQTLFALLGFLVDMSKEVTSSTDALSGNMGQNIQPTTLLALIEQGEKVFNAIYKRIYRSLKEEYKALYRLNAAYITDGTYLTFHDKKVSRDDFAGDDMDISPAADPQMANDVSEMTKIGVMEKFLGDPDFKQREMKSRMVRAAKLPEEIMVDEPDPNAPPPPDPVMMLETEKLKLESDKLHVQERKAAVDESKAVSDAQKTAILRKTAEADIALKNAQTMKALADAEAAEAGIQMDDYQRQLQFLKAAQDDDRLGMELERENFQRELQRPQNQPGISGGDQPPQTGPRPAGPRPV